MTGTLGFLLLLSTACWPAFFAVGYRSGEKRGLARGEFRRNSAFLRSRGEMLTMSGKVVSSPSALTHECGGLWGKWQRKTAKITVHTPSKGSGAYVYGRPVPKLPAAQPAQEIDVQERECDQCGIVERRRIN